LIPMINVKEAAKKAAQYFTDLYQSQFTNVLVEEIEQTGRYWFITLGYDLPNVFNALTQFAANRPRGFKVFKIDADTGEVISMKIREVEHVE